jgi:hypothetical protein
MSGLIKYGLSEIKLSGRNFTWSNNQEKAVMSHIDRIFCSTDFDAQFSLGWVKALARNPSDHVPLLWEDGQNQPKKVFRFKFEKWWLQHKDFEKLVESMWNAPIEGDRVILTNGKIELGLLEGKQKGGVQTLKLRLGRRRGA